MPNDNHRTITGNRNDIVGQLLEGMGDSATHEQAERLFDILRREGFITVDRGLLEYDFDAINHEGRWLAMLDEACREDAEDRE